MVMALINNKEIGLTDSLTLLSISEVAASKVQVEYQPSRNKSLGSYQ